MTFLNSNHTLSKKSLTTASGSCKGLDKRFQRLQGIFVLKQKFLDKSKKNIKIPILIKESFRFP